VPTPATTIPATKPAAVAGGLAAEGS
jgi:hypothetical protein